MAAGDSARDEADRLREYARAIEQRANNFLIAAESERTLSKYLKELVQFGWRILEDREWPNSSRANIDFIAVGPPGVLVIDAKEWADVTVAEGSLYRGDADETETVDKQVALIDRLADQLADHGLVPSAIESVLAFTNQDMKATPIGPITAIGATQLIGWLRRDPVACQPTDFTRLRTTWNCHVHPRHRGHRWHQPGRLGGPEHSTRSSTSP